MAAYKTGRSRTLTVSGEISGRVKTLPIPPDYSATFEGTVAALGCSLEFAATPQVRSISVGNGTSSDNDTDTSTISDSVLAGTFSFTVPVEEWVEYSESGSFPTYGGAAVDGDVPTEAVVTFTERTTVGQDIIATATLNGRTVTASDTITVADIVSAYTVSTMLEAWGMTRGPGGTSVQQDAAITIDYMDCAVPSYTRTRSPVTISASGGTIRVTTADIEEDVAEFHAGVINASVMPPCGFALGGQLRADLDAYATSSVVRIKRKAGESYTEITSASGSYSASYTQEQYSVGGQCDAIAQDTIALSEYSPTIYHWLVPPSGENANQWRLLLRGAYYDAGTIAQAETVALDGGFSFGDTGTTRTFSPAKSMAGYRYLLINTDQASKTITLKIGSKSWAVETDGSGLAIFDLCGPSNLATDIDARDSRWPIPTDVDHVDADGAMWGVVDVGEYTITAPAGVTCTVAANGVYLSRDTWASPPPGHSLLNVVAPQLYWVPSGTANTYKRPLLRGDTDGRRSLDEADWTRVVGTPTIYTARTIDNLFDDVNASDTSVVRNPGWTAVLDAGIDVADGAAGSDWEPGLLNRNRNASWIEGSGIAYYAADWHYGHDLDVSSALTLVAQMLVDKVTLYPMCGDVFGLRTGANRWEYGTTAEQGRAELRGGRYMRGAAWGLTLHENGIAHSGATVTQKELPDLTAAGSGKSDIRGEYLTGTPWGRAGYDHRLQPQVGAGATYIDRMLYGGTRLRSCFTVVPGSLGAIEADGPRAWLHICYGKRIRTYNLWGWDIVQESGEYAVESWLKLRTDPRRGSLHMLSDDGAGVLGLWTSYDGGMTGTEVATVTARSACIERDSERGTLVLMYENSGNVQRRVSLDGGDTWETATEPTLNGVAITGAILDMTQDTRRGVMLMALTQSGVTKVLESHDIGESWAVAVS